LANDLDFSWENPDINKGAMNLEHSTENADSVSIPPLAKLQHLQREAKRKQTAANMIQPILFLDNPKSVF